MLTGDQAVVAFESGRALPDRLTWRTHAAYVGHAARMLALYREGRGRTRRELHRAVDAILAAEPDCDPRRIRAFAKLLDDASEFAWDPEGSAADLRLRVFQVAARFHPLVERADGLFETSEVSVKETVARELGRPWLEIEEVLFADFPDQQRLLSFEPGYPDARALLSRYNVAQVQACLYRAEALTVHARADFKTILRYAKLARLLHVIVPAGKDAYRIDLSGPTAVLEETRRYGVDLARFLPALIACRDWSLRARVKTPWGWAARLELSSEDGLVSHLPAPSEFDSSIEERFAKKWGDEPREGWRLLREGRILSRNQTTFVPDFAFVHEDGLEVLFEIVGFWTPEYLAQKRETLSKFKGERILLAVPERFGHEVAPSKRAVVGVVPYKTAIKLEPVLAELRKARARAQRKARRPRAAPV